MDDTPRLPRSLREQFEMAISFQTFLDEARVNVELWRAMYARASVPEPMLARATALEGVWPLLVLTEDWCGDALNTLPVFARLAEQVTAIELRVLSRDAHPDLMARHLTEGRRSIPVAIVLDRAYEERGWWGPRPGPLQSWVRTEGRALDKSARYREMRRWYARDRGETALAELLTLLERAASEIGAAR